MTGTQPAVRDDPPRPPILYHYTSQRGLLGIVSENALRATNIHYLNDAAEFSYAVELLGERLFELKQDAEGRTVVFLDTFEKRLHAQCRAGLFVTAFSEREDLLSLWRGYCPSGGGFSIGFDLEWLERHMRVQSFTLARCVYDPSEHAQVLRVFIREVLDALHELQVHGLDRDRALDLLIQRFFFVAPTLKHPSFWEEREWRLISAPTAINDPKIRFATGQTMLRPYFNFSIAAEDEPLRMPKIVVGPAPHIELSVLSAEAFLQSNGVQFDRVEPSKIPYRGW